MTLPPPRIDMRSFQDIVDEAKRLIPRYVPEWTDHNLSDPGVALIELFAWMTESIIYRLNQIPDDIYLRFLDLLGISRFPAIAAQTDLVFMLSAPAEETVTVPTGTEVGTDSSGDEEPIVFMTDRDLMISPPQLSACLVSGSDAPGRYRQQWDELRFDGSEVTFFRTLQPDDAIYFGFEASLASLVIRLEISAWTEGVGVRPEDPPWAWEVWTGEVWEATKIGLDTTGGMNRDGEIVLYLPHVHEPITLNNERAYWLRCRMTEARPGQPPYHHSPELRTLEAFGVGGMVPAHHGELHERELLGVSHGEPEQSFYTMYRPILERRADETIEVVPPDGGEPAMWNEVADFSESGPKSHDFTLDAANGQVHFGPRIRYPDGTFHHFGAVPQRGYEIFLTAYRSGGGARGNVGAGTLDVMFTAVPFVDSVSNPEPATGGVDAETLENARARGAMTLRTGDRAVTAADFERLTLHAAPSVARASAIAPPSSADPVRILIVPRVEKHPSELTPGDMEFSDELFTVVQEYLEERRILGTAVAVGSPHYAGVSVVARVTILPGRNPDLVRDRAMTALYSYINPLTGGPDSRGWPFGLDLNVSQLFTLLSNVDGLSRVDEALLFNVNLATGVREPIGRQQIALEPGTLFMSHRHLVI